jgi:hypothetical protein
MVTMRLMAVAMRRVVVGSHAAHGSDRSLVLSRYSNGFVIRHCSSVICH